MCFSWINLKERDHSEDKGVDRRVLLKRIKEAGFDDDDYKHLAQEREQ
jgi:hypothetical protein